MGQEGDPNTWFDTMEELPDLDCDPPFDENGDHICTHKLAATFATIVCLGRSLPPSACHLWIQEITLSLTTMNSLIPMESNNSNLDWSLAVDHVFGML